MTDPRPGPDCVKVLVVDDHPVTLAGLRALLGHQTWVDVVLAAATSHDARFVAQQEKPALALLDLKMPTVEDGIALIKWSRKAVPDCRLLIVTMFGEPDNVQRCLDAGAHGFLAKDAPTDLVLAAAQAVLHGANVFGADLAVGAQLPGTDTLDPALNGLTPRELDVMCGLADGLDNEHLARRLRVSPRRVSNLISSAVGKTGRNGRVDLALFAKDHGLASGNSDKPT